MYTICNMKGAASGELNLYQRVDDQGSDEERVDPVSRARRVIPG